MSAKTEVLGALSIKYTGESPPEGKNGKKVKSGVSFSTRIPAMLLDNDYSRGSSCHVLLLLPFIIMTIPGTAETYRANCGWIIWQCCAGEEGK